MELRVLQEGAETITLGWTPPTGVGAYVLYAGGEVVSVATRTLKTGAMRDSARFHKTNPGPPFQVAAVVRAGNAVAVDVGSHPPVPLVLFPALTRYPSERAA